MISIPWIWVGGLVTSGVVMHQVLKPRLPVYTIQPCLGWPKLVFDGYQVMVGLPMTVSMYNENYVEIDVYRLTFDMFYGNDMGELLHVADIKDHSQVEQQRRDGDNKSNNNSTTSPRPDAPAAASVVAAVWQIPSRSNFTTDDILYMGIDSSFVTNLLWNSRFYSSLWKGSGSFWLPTTGVAHVKASGKGVKHGGIRVTISIICDNFVNSLVVQGLSCVLHDAQPGWADLKNRAQSMRTHAETKLRVTDLGTVLAVPKNKQ